MNKKNAFIVLSLIIILILMSFAQAKLSFLNQEEELTNQKITEEKVTNSINTLENIEDLIRETNKHLEKLKSIENLNQNCVENEYIRTIKLLKEKLRFYENDYSEFKDKILDTQLIYFFNRARKNCRNEIKDDEYLEIPEEKPVQTVEEPTSFRMEISKLDGTETQIITNYLPLGTELQHVNFMDENQNNVELSIDSDGNLYGLNSLNTKEYSIKFYSSYVLEFEEEPILEQLNKGIRKTKQEIASSIESEQDQFKKDIKGKISSFKESQIKNEFKETFNGMAVKLTDRELKEVKKLPNVKVYEDNIILANLYDSVEIIKADELWDLGFYGTGITIAILDTGVDKYHPDLIGRIIDEDCYESCHNGNDEDHGFNSALDDHGHGTHCAGIAAGNGTIVGVAPGANIHAIKVLSSEGSGSISGIIAGIEKAVQSEVDIISLSLGGSGNPDDPASQAIDNAVESGIVAVIAAGNDGPYYNSIGSPGTARKAITVGASSKPNQHIESLAEFSSRGPVLWSKKIVSKPDIIAPGISICAAQHENAWEDNQCLDDEHTAISGTSMATPHVAGVVALLLDANPSLTPQEIKSALMTTSVNQIKCVINNSEEDFEYSCSNFNESECLQVPRDCEWENNHCQGWAIEECQYLNTNICEIVPNCINKDYLPVEQGTGLINVLEAMSPTININPLSINFEEDSNTSEILVKNLKNYPITIELNIGLGTEIFSQQEANIINFDEGQSNVITIPANNQETVNFQLNENINIEGSFTGFININESTSNKTMRIPYVANKLSELTINFDNAGGTPLILIQDVNFKYFYSDYVENEANSKTIYIPGGNEYVYSFFSDFYIFPEVMLMGSINLPVQGNEEVTLNYTEDNLFTVVEKSFDNRDLKLDLWEKGVCHKNRELDMRYCFTMSDPTIGNKNLYVSNRPSENLDTDVFFRTSGVPINE